jgi:hypothetical protein
MHVLKIGLPETVFDAVGEYYNRWNCFTKREVGNVKQ